MLVLQVFHSFQQDYCLGFGSFPEIQNRWNGGAASILSSAGAEVWGVVWCISNNEEECLSMYVFSLKPKLAGLTMMSQKPGALSLPLLADNLSYG